MVTHGHTESLYKRGICVTIAHHFAPMIGSGCRKIVVTLIKVRYVALQHPLELEPTLGLDWMKALGAKLVVVS